MNSPKTHPGIRDFLLQEVANHPRDLVPHTAQHFGVTRPAVHRHLSRLIQEGKIIKTGRTRAATYYLQAAKNKSLVFPISKETEEHQIWKNYLEESFTGLQKNIFDICIHGFGEIVNNALDHSEGKKIWIKTQWKSNQVTINIMDDGIGIFRKIKNALGLDDERESMLQLSKGKFTTDPDNHTGEGIYFTSRMFDDFFISSHALTYMRINPENDWFLKSVHDEIPGTYVSMKIALDSKADIYDVYSQFTLFDKEEGVPKFEKTHILVELSKTPDERYISRSQAKRILLGLDKFKHIILDFKNVETVGQGFVDEVFRIFPQRFPGIQMEYKNTNDNVTFMIERGLPRS